MVGLHSNVGTSTTVITSARVLKTLMGDGATCHADVRKDGHDSVSFQWFRMPDEGALLGYNGN